MLNKTKYKISTKDLIYRQSLPLEAKLPLTKARIREYFTKLGCENVYLSYSGGMDSTVLKHIIEQVINETKYFTMPTIVYLDTWLEYPEVRQHVIDSCAGQELIRIKPKLSMEEIVKKCGWCFPSKEMAE